MDLIDELITEIAATAKSATATAAIATVPEPAIVTIFTFYFSNGGQCGRLDVPIADAVSLLRGDIIVGVYRPEAKNLLRSASVVINNTTYKFLAYSDRGSTAPDQGLLSETEFRHLLSEHKGRRASHQNCYIVKLDASNMPVSISSVDDEGGVSDPFVKRFFGYD